MSDSRTTSKPRPTISNIPIKAFQTGRTGGSLVFVFPAWRRTSPFLSGNLDFTSLNQERNSIPNESIQLETLPQGFPHGGLLRNFKNDTEGASRNQIPDNYGKGSLSFSLIESFLTWPLGFLDLVV